MMLRVDGIEVFYSDLQALHGVSFEVNEKELVSMIGANGAGKSTTIMTISGILKSSNGKIWFKKKEIQRFRPSRIVEMGISQIPEGRQLFPSLTVFENLETGSHISRARKERGKTLEWIFELFPLLKERKDQLAGTLSGGEQQMLAIGRGLMSLPELLMLDEPSLGLSPILVSHIFNIIQEINRSGTTIFLVEQNVYHALKMSHRAYILENGSIVLEGKGEELMQNPHVKEAYLGL
jgi:branched-chain amino acid transport system ATP-binding protein